MSFNTEQPSYQSLRDIVAERTEPLVFWIGAGLSARAGLPTWGQLQHSLLDALEDKAASRSGEAKSHLQSIHKAVSNFDDTWLSFDRLQEALGQATFRECIRNELQAAPSASLPAVYTQLWQVEPSGILNLNLDRLATRAFHTADLHGHPSELTGFKAGENHHILKKPSPFIVNLHGNLEDQSSWVLTKSKLSALTNNEGYRSFLQACISSKTIVFVGLSLEDRAIDSHLNRLRDIADGAGRHFWITHNTDIQTDAWAEGLGVSIINYNVENDDHSELDDLFDDLLSYVSTDTPRPPVIATTSQESLQLPSPEELARQDPNDIREILNIAANEILENRTEEAYERFASFCDQYDEAIYRAWYLRDEPGKNHLLDYTLDEKVDEGAFGSVYRSKRNGDLVAIKVLHERIRAERPMLETFRRGIHSMKILEDHDIDGVVTYKDASEIPAFVVMEWIRGPTLTEAVEANQLDTWDRILETAVQTTRIIHNAHSVPERVLHRDLRPNNIMLRKWWTNHEIDVVVLDFDLSWHRGSVEKSLVYEAAPNGFLAPEQLAGEEFASTRHAAVDAFGLGMTLYFMCAREAPAPGAHRHDDWDEQVDNATNRIGCDPWQSLPTRVARAIKSATRHSQSQRWDVSQVLGELELLHEALLRPHQVTSAEMIAQELGARLPQSELLKWDPDDYESRLQIPTPKYLTISADESEGTVQLTVGWESQGLHDHQNVAKWLPDATSRARSILRKANWTIDDSEVAGDRAQLAATGDARNVRNNFDRYTASIDQALEQFTFE